jgi:hypothetical protein
VLARPYHAHPRPVLVEAGLALSPAAIPSGVEIVVTLGRLAAAFLDRAERPERQMVTHKMQTVSHFNEYLAKTDWLIRIAYCGFRVRC